MRLQDIGEFGLIDRIGRDAVTRPESLVLGIGDDAAAYVASSGALQLASTDMLVEGVHFDLELTAPQQLGHKALAVNLSDIAAMGGTARQVLVSVALPPHISVEFVEAFYDGLKALARRFGVNLVGGDTVAASGGLTIGVTVIGEVTPQRLCRRSGAQPGDLVAVTGTLGDAAAGLAWLRRSGGAASEPFACQLVRAQLTPTPRLAEGAAIAQYARSMDDISDGVAREAREIAAASGVGMRLRADALPLSAALCEAARLLGTPPSEFALFGGEDYELLFTLERRQYAQLCTARPTLHTTVIGEVTVQAGLVELEMDGKVVELPDRGYTHFREA